MKFSFECCTVLLFLLLADSSEGFYTCRTPSLKFGRVRSKQRGRMLKFTCRDDYQLTGTRTATCVNGLWNVPIPKCVRGTCPKKDISLNNGVVLPTHNGGVLNFYCQRGYKLNGPPAIFCDGFNWDNHKPSCIASNTQPKLFCDFEDADLCHWTHDLNHDMDWSRESHKTPTGYSMSTGPSFDHTKGNGSDGHYMYVEASSRQVNDTARLISPIFPKMDGHVCLEFWYHMYGKNTGTLRTYLKKISDPWPLIPKEMVFTESGNQGDVWYRALLDLGLINEGFQIIMEGLRGNGYVGDLAVDDIKLIPNCSYDDLVYSTTEVIPSVSEVMKTVESCENRCGQKAFGNESVQVLACDCDDFCYNNSRCCPDFIEFCFTQTLSTDWTTVPDDDSSLIETTTVNQGNGAIGLNVTALTSTLAPPRPTLKILEPITTPKIVRKLLPPTPASKITFVKPKNPQIVPNKAVEEDDVAMPALPSEEESNDINSHFDDVQEKEEIVEKLAGHKDYPLKTHEADKVGEFKTDFIQVQKDTSHSTLVLIVIATVCTVVLLGFGVGLVWTKVKLMRLRGRRITTSGQGDSQSDVRFLTADEVLDFGLDNDYEDL